MNDLSTTDRKIISFFLCIALLTFFLPLVTIQIPVLGNQDVSGYDIFSKARQFDDKLNDLRPKGLDRSGNKLSQSPEDSPYSTYHNESIPLSVQTIPIIPFEAIASLVFAFIGLLCCLNPFRSGIMRVVCVFGSIFAIVTILHITIANSDLHTWFQERVSANSSGLNGNPFDQIGRSIITMVANTFQIKPSIGLYVLAATLIMASVFSYSRRLSTVPSDEPVIDSYSTSDGEQGRVIAFIVIIGVVVIIAFVLFSHKTSTNTSTNSVTPPTMLSDKSSEPKQKSPEYDLPTDRLSKIVPDSITLDTSMRHRVVVNPFSPEHPPTAMRTVDGEWSQAKLVYSGARADVYIATKEIDGLVNAKPSVDWSNTGFGLLILSDFKPDARNDLANKYNLQEIDAEHFRYIEHATYIDTAHSKMTTLGTKLIDTYGESFYTSPETRESKDLLDSENVIELNIMNNIIQILSAKTKTQ
jgi:hypothetical protein